MDHYIIIGVGQDNLPIHDEVTSDNMELVANVYVRKHAEPGLVLKVAKKWTKLEYVLVTVTPYPGGDFNEFLVVYTWGDGRVSTRKHSGSM